MNSILRVVLQGAGQLPYLLVCIVLLSHSANGQGDDVKKLKALSIEELMNIEVTSVSKGPQRLRAVASAIQVITHDGTLKA